jgi:carboxyl-terminal processing protease
VRQLRTLRRPAALLAALAATAAVTTAAGAAGAARASGQTASPAPCSLKGPPIGTTKPTTVTTIGQAYSCIYDHYYAAATLDDRVLLAAAFAGLTQELDRLGLDQPDATLPALTGNHNSDWTRFAAVYQRITGKLPARSREQAAVATMYAMIAALNNNHSYWEHVHFWPGCHRGRCTRPYGLGLYTFPDPLQAKQDPGAALPPLYVNYVDPHSPAARHGVRVGDVITKVDGSAPFTDGTYSPGVTNLLNQQYPQRQTVRLTLRWPVTGATRTITLTPTIYNPGTPPPPVSKVLAGHIGYVQLFGFDPGPNTDRGKGCNAGCEVRMALSALEKKAKLRGLILDVRGNGGGAPAGIASVVGLFEHGHPWGYSCPLTGTCTAQYPNRKMPLEHLPLAVLTDRGCASACDQFAGAVKDLHLGTLIGTRTAGVSGAAGVFSRLLNDGSVLQLTTKTFLAAGHEIIDGIGVAPDYYLPLTAKDVATGHDPDIAKALTVLGR